MAGEDTRDPDGTDTGETANAGQPRRRETTEAPAAAPEPPDYDQREQSISTTRRHAGPPIPEGVAPGADADEEPEEGPTDP